MRLKANGFETAGTYPGTAGWTTFSPFAIGANAHYLVNNLRNGSVAVNKVSANGVGASTIWWGTWTPGWA